MTDRAHGWLLLSGVICAVGVVGCIERADSDLDAAAAMIAADEGFSGQPYTDTTGNMTIGYGTKLPITKPEGMLLLRYRLNGIWSHVEGAHAVVDRLPVCVLVALQDMSYQLGAHGEDGFTGMWAALDRGDYSAAADAALDSKWARETPNRAARVAALMRKCR